MKRSPAGASGLPLALQLARPRAKIGLDAQSGARRCGAWTRRDVALLRELADVRRWPASRTSSRRARSATSSKITTPRPRRFGSRLRLLRRARGARSRCTTWSGGRCARAAGERRPTTSATCGAHFADSLHARALAGDLRAAHDQPGRPGRRSRPSRRAATARTAASITTSPGPDRALAPDTRARRSSMPSRATCSSRDAAGEPRGYAIASPRTPSRPRALPDPRLGRWLERARGGSDRLAPTRSASSRACGAARHGRDPCASSLRDPRWRLRIDPRSRAALAFSAAVGARHVPELFDADGWECARARLRRGCSARSASPRPARAGLADPRVDVRKALHDPPARR